MRASSWIAARAYADAGTDAHTNPVYVYFGHVLPFDEASARHIMARLEGSAGAIAIPEIVTRLKALQIDLRDLIRDRTRTNLPRAEIAR